MIRFNSKGVDILAQQGYIWERSQANFIRDESLLLSEEAATLSTQYIRARRLAMVFIVWLLWHVHWHSCRWVSFETLFSPAGNFYYYPFQKAASLGRFLLKMDWRQKQQNEIANLCWRQYSTAMQRLEAI